MINNSKIINKENNLLVADDEMNIVEGLKALLIEEGYVVYNALDGLEALKIDRVYCSALSL